ncbi:acyl-CoA-binding domain-containing protein 5 [Drosophila sulfurigaster albostrigata]|uniref:acyl-CoA-binding domain-containing protein 5 n=1 Tax=Drosophila sulfurigaster albostrigata TaxID=89887 RepID=UPI002D21AAE6|nr:acyl-CoA-binding domain-containing protein 5 [Drosophila sulfurigaster albostrigata]XP_062121396.1 acyl-CoA-binding domain-containing protein 5 [Drosophila sulfurigaster albostrigata]XP_062121397.1 acyl-CoA-binding domain-containing protein 5 [Drosophila sulfurigaster albostrigata]XP_062121398.1 acyl-CoA-binding domain-containing protein 5 [Drosophila sulfurigaster albostrigata]
MAGIEERFQAAVNVIKGLPKNGPYQPSTSMMLKFYGLFKQASEGSCSQKKPAFWDVVGRAKWDAWNNNSQLSKEQAMQRYVESLQEIIETMSFTENVQNFVGSLDGLGNINLDELELVSPGMRELAESHPNSPFHSRTNSPQHGSSSNEDITATETPVASTNGHATPLSNGYASKLSNGYGEPTTTTTSHNYTHNSSVAIVDPSDDEYDDPYDTMLPQELTQAITHNTDMLRQIQSTIASMNNDMAAVQQRVRGMEQTLLELRKATSATSSRRQQPAWWPFKNISPLWFAVLVLWPFLVRRVARLVESKRR